MTNELELAIQRGERHCPYCEQTKPFIFCYTKVNGKKVFGQVRGGKLWISKRCFECAALAKRGRYSTTPHTYTGHRVDKQARRARGEAV